MYVYVHKHTHTYKDTVSWSWIFCSALLSINFSVDIQSNRFHYGIMFVCVHACVRECTCMGVRMSVQPVCCGRGTWVWMPLYLWAHACRAQRLLQLFSSVSPTSYSSRVSWKTQCSPIPARMSIQLAPGSRLWLWILRTMGSRHSCLLFTRALQILI